MAGFIIAIITSLLIFEPHNTIEFLKWLAIMSVIYIAALVIIHHVKLLTWAIFDKKESIISTIRFLPRLFIYIPLAPYFMAKRGWHSTDVIGGSLISKTCTAALGVIVGLMFQLIIFGVVVGITSG